MIHVGSLFSGIGGLDLGLEWAGMEILWQCEKDPFCRGVLRQHWPHARLYDDITTLDATDLAPVDLICGGFPCQPVSLAGRRRGKDDSRWLWPAMRDIISVVSPTWVLGENTPGLITMGLDGVLADLETLGYACRTFVVPACAVDAPHRRDRVFIVAHASRGGRDQGSTSLPGQAGWETFVGDGGEGAVADASGEQVGTAGQSREYGHVADANQLDGDNGGYETGGIRREQQATAKVPKGQGLDGAMGDAYGQGLPLSKQPGEPGEAKCGHRQRATTRQPGGPWSDVEWIVGADGKARRVKPGICLLAHGIPGRVARLKACGNAVVPEDAYRFGRAIMLAEALVWANCADMAVQTAEVGA